MNGFRHNVSKQICFGFEPPMHVKLSDLPVAVDWRSEGLVSEVKNQVSYIYAVYVKIF